VTSLRDTSQRLNNKLHSRYLRLASAVYELFNLLNFDLNYCKMPHCMVPECFNNSRDQHQSVSFHRVPTNEKSRKKWLDVVPRKIPRPASYSYVCSDHFSSDCFEVSYMEQLTGHKQSRRLKPGSIPSISPRSASRLSI
jgi:hypothetical protein